MVWRERLATNHYDVSAVLSIKLLPLKKREKRTPSPSAADLGAALVGILVGTGVKVADRHLVVYEVNIEHCLETESR